MESDLPNLTKAQRKKLKKEQREKERQQEQTERERKARMRKTRKYTVAFLILIVVAGLWYFASRPQSGTPMLELEKSSYNLGDVSQKDGKVSFSVGIKNAGDSDLVINSMATSCMCTSASLIVDGKESPEFGMHSKPGFWSQDIKPQQEGQIKIMYDPNVHPELKGPVTRIVTIVSNDPRYPQKQIKVQLNQIP